MNRREIIVTTEAGDWPSASEQIAATAAEVALGQLLSDRAGNFELGVTLADDATVQDLNRRYRGQDRPTNVLSFPLTEGATDDGADSDPDLPVLLGDVILAAETVAAEASAQGKPHQHHLAHLVVHGVLHLMGHDHQTDADADRMERLETGLLAGLGIDDPYSCSTHDPAGAGTPDRPNHETARR